MEEYYHFVQRMSLNKLGDTSHPFVITFILAPRHAPKFPRCLVGFQFGCSILPHHGLWLLNALRLRYHLSVEGTSFSLEVNVSTKCFSLVGALIEAFVFPRHCYAHISTKCFSFSFLQVAAAMVAMAAGLLHSVIMYSLKPFCSLQVAPSLRLPQTRTSRLIISQSVCDLPLTPFDCFYKA